MIRQVEVKDTKWLCSDGQAFYSRDQAALHEAIYIVKHNVPLGFTSDKSTIVANTIMSAISRAREAHITKARMLNIINELWVD